ncbi:hypothetical protein [Pseudozobellia thermophila]|uniref:Uncharacterized protein n=1 Tax=Pseudozobellia thermophila TaxID=192903 RepID=A0A1M6G4L2_9FLAO|nr:hypothetical protein [Pseudozobellia thermophila]SHJ04899.1 hypothetical protein SAMN04488513_102675 [Pseudozobellia thermophila]
MLSLRHNGRSISEIVGIYLGPGMKLPMRLFDGTGNLWNLWVYIGIITAYYILSTLLPIDKMIGKPYPVFGMAMLLMGLGFVFACLSAITLIPVFL